MPHFQSGVNKWLEAVNLLPNGFCIKAVDQLQLLVEAKNAKPGIKTCLRHWYDNNYVFGGTLEENKQRARVFFSTFIDNTFKASASKIDYVEELNEYLASSHTGAELQDRITWARAAAEVWKNEYRTQPGLSHIRLVLINAPVGNDINVAFAQIAAQNDCAIGYHGYDHWISGQRDPGSWQYHAGRWVGMDAAFRAAGYTIQWVFTEAGPYSSAIDGWKHANVHNGDLGKYVESVKWFINQCKTTNAYQTGRILGFHLFTSGGGSQWNKFETAGDDLVAVCQTIGANWNSVPVPPAPPVPPEPPDPPDPPIPPTPQPGGNLLRHADFEGYQTWYDGPTGQVPNEWLFEYYLGNNPYHPWPYVRPETRVILKSQLPAGEWEAFGLSGNQAIKAFWASGNWHGAYIQMLPEPLSKPSKATFRFFADLVTGYEPVKTYATYDPNNPAGMVQINDTGWVLIRPGEINELVVNIPAGATQFKVATKFHYPLANNGIFFDNPELVEVAPTPPPVEPVPYVVVVNLLPQNTTQAEKTAVVAAVHTSKETVLQSADDAARLVAPGKAGSKVVVYAPERWTDDIVAWLKARGVLIVETRPMPPF